MKLDDLINQQYDEFYEIGVSHGYEQGYQDALHMAIGIYERANKAKADLIPDKVPFIAPENAVEDEDEHFESVGSDESDTETADDKKEATDTNTPDDDLDAKYSTQLNDSDAKLEKPILIKVDGEVMELTTIDSLRNMAERGTSVTKKFQKLAQDRRALEEQIKALGAEPDVDVQDDDADTKSAEELDRVANVILASDYADDFKSSVSDLPKDAVDFIGSKPEILHGLSEDFKSGLAQKIMPQVKREMIVKGTDFITSYIAIGRQLQQSDENVQAQKQLLGAEPKHTKYTTPTADVNNMSTDEFDKYFDSL